MNRCCASIWLAGLVLLLGGCAAAPDHNTNRQAAARANAMLGLSLLGQQHYDRALEKFQQALTYDDDSIRANWGMALLHQHRGQPEQARSFYEQIVGSGATPAILNSYAVFLCQRGRITAALEYFKKAANDQRNNKPATALANAGLCLEQAGTLATARTFYGKALIANEGELAALAGMARLEYGKARYSSARTFIKRADAAHELSPNLLLLAAQTELRLGRHDAAQAFLRRHNKRKPAAAMTIRQLKHLPQRSNNS